MYKKNGRQRQRVPIGANPQYNQKRRRTLLLGSKRVQVYPHRYGRRTNKPLTTKIYKKTIRIHNSPQLNTPN